MYVHYGSLHATTSIASGDLLMQCLHLVDLERRVGGSGPGGHQRTVRVYAVIVVILCSCGSSIWVGIGAYIILVSESCVSKYEINEAYRLRSRLSRWRKTASRRPYISQSNGMF